MVPLPLERPGFGWLWSLIILQLIACLTKFVPWFELLSSENASSSHDHSFLPSSKSKCLSFNISSQDGRYWWKPAELRFCLHSEVMRNKSEYSPCGERRCS